MNSTSTTLGVLGLGNLGRAIAERLSAQGHPLVVWNRTPSKAAGLDATVAPTPGDVARLADVLLVNVRDSAAVRRILTADDGVLALARPGQVVIDTTTNHADQVLDFHAACRDRGVAYVEAPVAGSVVPARNGALTLFGSADDAAFERARPFLEQLAQKIVRFPQPGQATRMKLVNNLVLGGLMALLGEAVALGEAAGLDRALLLEGLEHGAGNTAVLKAKKQKLLSNDWSPHFSCDVIHKDLGYLAELASDARRGSPLGDAARTLYAKAIEQGHAIEDFSAVIEVLRKG
jgi:3-hydroxyisobutyrate dehydrogenase